MRAVNVLLTAAILASAMALVYVRYESRLAFSALHALDQDRDRMNVEYGQLLAERATWSLYDMVETAAGERLEMRRPEPDEVVTLAILPEPRR